MVYLSWCNPRCIAHLPWIVIWDFQSGHADVCLFLYTVSCPSEISAKDTVNLLFTTAFGAAKSGRKHLVVVQHRVTPMKTFYMSAQVSIRYLTFFLKETKLIWLTHEKKTIFCHRNWLVSAFIITEIECQSVLLSVIPPPKARSKKKKKKKRKTVVKSGWMNQGVKNFPVAGHIYQVVAQHRQARFCTKLSVHEVSVLRAKHRWSLNSWIVNGRFFSIPLFLHEKLPAIFVTDSWGCECSCACILYKRFPMMSFT